MFAKVAEPNHWDNNERTLCLKLALKVTAAECAQGEKAEEIAVSLMSRGHCRTGGTRTWVMVDDIERLIQELEEVDYFSCVNTLPESYIVLCRVSTTPINLKMI